MPRATQRTCEVDVAQLDVSGDMIHKHALCGERINRRDPLEDTQAALCRRAALEEVHE